jgi:hypothetical protein
MLYNKNTDVSILLTDIVVRALVESGGIEGGVAEINELVQSIFLSNLASTEGSEAGASASDDEDWGDPEDYDEVYDNKVRGVIRTAYGDLIFDDSDFQEIWDAFYHTRNYPSGWSIGVEFDAGAILGRWKAIKEQKGEPFACPAWRNSDQTWVQAVRAATGPAAGPEEG